MKTAGSLLIIAFFALIGIKLVSFRKSQITFLDDMLYLCDLIRLYLEGSMAETSEIIYRIENDDRLSKYKFYELCNSSPLTDSANEYVIELQSLLGRYDVDIQLEKIRKISLYFDKLKESYVEQYKNHSKLCLVFSISSGFLVVILLI